MDEPCSTFLGLFFEPVPGVRARGAGTSTLTKVRNESSDSDVLAPQALGTKTFTASKETTDADPRVDLLATQTHTRTNGEANDADVRAASGGIWSGALL